MSATVASAAAGRGPTRKDERLEARVSAETKALCQEAAAIQGQSLTDFVVGCAIESAKRILREKELIELTQRDRLAFVSSLLNPPSPNRRLREAARHYQQVLGNR
jgi:uncharacterized protein (DUF1778 family)